MGFLALLILAILGAMFLTPLRLQSSGSHPSQAMFISPLRLWAISLAPLKLGSHPSLGYGAPGPNTTLLRQGVQVAFPHLPSRSLLCVSRPGPLVGLPITAICFLGIPPSVPVSSYQ